RSHMANTNIHTPHIRFVFTSMEPLPSMLLTEWPSPWEGNNGATVESARRPGMEFPGSVVLSRLKPTARGGLESPSGDFPTTQPGNSFPGVQPAAVDTPVHQQHYRL